MSPTRQPSQPRQPARPPGNAETAVAVATPKESLEHLQAELKAQTDALRSVLPNAMGVDRFTEVVARAVARDAKLLRCTPLSLMRSIMDAAALGFEPTGKYGGAYLVPFWNKDLGSYEATMIPSFNGLTDLAYRSGIVTLIEGDTDGVVYAADEFDYVRGWPDTHLRHVRALAGDRGEVVGAWSMVHLREAPRPLILFLPEADIEKRRKVSRSGANDDGSPKGIWRQWPDEMRAKTVLRANLDLAPRAVLDRIAPALEAEDRGDSRMAAAAPAPQLDPGQSDRRRRLLAGAVGAEIGVDDDEPPEGDDAPGRPETEGPAKVAPEGTGAENAAGSPGARGEAPETGGTPQDAETTDGETRAESDALCGVASPHDATACYLKAGHPAGRDGGGHRSETSTW